MAGPIEQFEIIPIVPIEIGNLDLSYTNSALWMTIAIAAITVFMLGGVRRARAVPSRWQAAVEMSFEFIANMVRDNVGQEGRRYFPFVFAMFMFILFGNLLGMVPYSFTFTSHIIITFALAMLVFVLITVIGIMRHGMHWFSYFVPNGVPGWLTPIIAPIEVISYLSRPISLSVRLFANMMAGHTMLKVFAGFTGSMLAAGVVTGIAGIAPLAINVALTGFEFLVAVLQAYVFTILTCLYLHDAIHLH